MKEGANLQPLPPHWDKEKRINYRDEAGFILAALKEGNDYLVRRLEMKMEAYTIYL